VLPCDTVGGRGGHVDVGQAQMQRWPWEGTRQRDQGSSTEEREKNTMRRLATFPSRRRCTPARGRYSLSSIPGGSFEPLCILHTAALYRRCLDPPIPTIISCRLLRRIIETLQHPPIADFPRLVTRVAVDTETVRRLQSVSILISRSPQQRPLNKDIRLLKAACIRLRGLGARRAGAYPSIER
jgi:hypothetical protein